MQQFHDINNGMLFYLLVEGSLQKINGIILATIYKSSSRRFKGINVEQKTGFKKNLRKFSEILLT